MKRIVCGMLAVAVLLLGLAVSGEARSPHGHFHGGVWIGAPFLWGAPWVYPAWPPYPYYSPPPVVIERQAPVYIQPAPQPQYWYYCQNPQGYYPYIQRCPGGWLQVVPSTPSAP